MINLRDVAKSELSLSPIMDGREKILTPALVGKELTIVAFDFITIQDKTYPVLLFKEFPNHFYSGGTLLNKLCVAWTNECGSVDAACTELANCGGVKVKISERRTKTGNNIVAVEVL